MTNQNHQPVAGTTEQKQVTNHVTLPPNKITIDPDIQQRVQHIDPNVVDDYAEAMSAGENLPPVNVFGDSYILADGFHRVEAAKKAGLEEISVAIHSGNCRDAILCAVCSNARHGVRRTRADKRKAVETLLSDDEWKQWGDREIARHAGVTHPFVGKIREHLETLPDNKEPALDPEIADAGYLETLPDKHEPIVPRRKVERKHGNKKQIYEQKLPSKKKRNKTIDPEKAIENWKSHFVDLYKFEWTSHDGFEIGKRCISGLKKAIEAVSDKEKDSLFKEFGDLHAELNRSDSK